MHQRASPIMVNLNMSFDKGYRLETSYIFLLLGTGIFLVLFYIYAIVPYAPAFLHSFLLLVTIVKGISPKHHLYLYYLVLAYFLCYSIPNRQYPTHQHFSTVFALQAMFTEMHTYLFAGLEFPHGAPFFLGKAFVTFQGIGLTATTLRTKFKSPE